VVAQHLRREGISVLLQPVKELTFPVMTGDSRPGCRRAAQLLRDGARDREGHRLSRLRPGIVCHRPDRFGGRRQVGPMTGVALAVSSDQGCVASAIYGE